MLVPDGAFQTYDVAFVTAGTEYGDVVVPKVTELDPVIVPILPSGLGVTVNTGVVAAGHVPLVTVAL